MNTVWLCLLLYWLLSMFFFWFCFRACAKDEDQTASESWWDQLGRNGKLVVYVVTGVAAPVAFPVALCAFVSGIVRHHLYWKSALKTHRDYVCERIHTANLPAEVEAYFDEQTPEVTELGFFEAGNYIVAREPLLMYGRYFLHEDLPTYYAIIHIGDVKSQCLVTLFDDGSVNETSPDTGSLCAKEFPVSCPVHARFVDPEATAPEYLKQHLDGVVARQELTGAQPLRYETHQLPDVMVHEKRVFSKLKQAQGEITSDVPDTVVPEGTVVDIHSLLESAAT